MRPRPSKVAGCLGADSGSAMVSSDFQHTFTLGSSINRAGSGDGHKSMRVCTSRIIRYPGLEQDKTSDGSSRHWGAGKSPRSGSPKRERCSHSASGYLLVNKGCPPTLLIHGGLDTLIWHRQSARLDARLGEFGGPHYFLSLPWATHAFDFNLNGPGGQLTAYAIEYFLATVTK